MTKLAICALLLSAPAWADPPAEEAPVDEGAGGQPVRRDDQVTIGPGKLCEFGGLKRYYWIDANGDDARQDDEVDEVRLYCRTDYRSEKALRKKAWREGEVARGKWVVTTAEELEALSGVQVLEGSLHVEGSDLERLDGLDELETIDGDLVVEGNPDLVDLPAFTALVRVGGELVVADNASLEALDAFHALVEVDGVRIEGTPLRQVDAFEGVTELESLVLADLGQLETLPEWSALAAVVSELNVERVGLISLALPGLERAGSLRVSECAALSSVALSALATSGSTELVDLPALAAVDLPALETADALRVARVPELSSLALPALREVGGTVVVEQAEALAAVQLDALGSVGGPLRVQGSPVTELSLSSLTSVEGDLELHDLARLGVLAGLSALARVKGGLELVSLPALSDLAHLVALREVGGVLRIEKTGITSLELNGLERLGGLDVYANHQLGSVRGFDALTDSEGAFRVRGNEALTQIEGFRALAEVERFSVDGNEAVQSLIGLDALARVGTLEFAGSDELTQVPGFEALAEADLVRFAYTGGLDALPDFPALARGGFDIENVDRLKALPECGALRELTELRVVGNDALKSLPALPALEVVSGDVAVSGQPKLKRWGNLTSTLRIDGGLYLEDQKKAPNFGELQSIGGDLVVIGGVGLSGSSFPKLQQVGALGFQGWTGKALPRFAALARVERDLVLADNAVLLRLDGLSALRQVGGELTVARNLVLEDVSGLHGLEEVGGQVLFIDNSRQCASSTEAFGEATGLEARGQGLDDGC